MFQTNPHYAKPSPTAAWLQNIDASLLNALVLTIAALAVAAVFLFAISRSVSNASRRRKPTALHPVSAAPPSGHFTKLRAHLLAKPWAMHDPANQMKAIAQVGFKTVPLLNRSEYKLLPLLESIARDLRSGHWVMAQTSLGEILKISTAPDDNLKSAAFASINAKRLDFAIFDRAGHIALAIEYQGQGHYQPSAFMRDAVKREALRKAGVPFLEVAAMFRPADVRAEVEKILNGDPAARPQPSAAATSSGVPTA
jgi:hypothetical protein